MKYYAFDIETTGLDPKTDRVIELALITPEQSYSWLINSGAPVSGQITELTGISQEMIDQDGVNFNAAWQVFGEIAGECDRLIGHNALAFDAPFLGHEIQRYNLPKIGASVVDTAALYKGFRLGKAFWPPEKPHLPWAKWVLNTRAFGLKFNLAHASREMGLEVPDGLHRAEADARLTLALFHKMLEKWPEIEGVI